MKKIILLYIALIIFVFFSPSITCAGGGHDHGHGHDEHQDEPEKGPHRGRLLKTDDFAIEVTIFEDGVPPQYRIFAYDDERLLNPDEYKVSITIDRPMRGKDMFEFQPMNNYMTSEKTVEEPHSFVVNVSAKYREKDYAWQYDSFEGRTTLSEEALKVANVTIETAQPERIHSTTEVFGRILPNEDKVAHIFPRFPGIIKEIRKKLGDTVEKGDLLAVVESNQSLQVYEIRSLISGTVVKRHATLGEFAPEDKELFIVADLSEVWADFLVYRDDFTDITVGQEISIQVDTHKKPILAKVSYVSPLTDIATQSKLIRAVVSNQDTLLRPGLFISGLLSSVSSEVSLAVKREAIQTFRDWKVVFITDGHSFQAIPVELGKQDQKYVEVLSGLKLGDHYVSLNSFIIKADIEKSGASHDH